MKKKIANTKRKILRALEGKEEIKTDKEHYAKNEISPQRELAFNILDEFEDLLEAHDLTIPDRDREGNKDEGRIYGTTYYNLEDKITELIEEFLKKEGFIE